MSSNNQENPNAGAVSVSNEESSPVQPRQPRNLQGLLRFAMEATAAEDAPAAPTLGPMDEERRKFLEEAMKNLTVDAAQILRSAITILSDKDKLNVIQLGEPLPDDVKAAFDNIMELIDDIDIANDFEKLNGFSIFPICFASENEEIRNRANRVMAELCQNNPQCQALALECGMVNMLLSIAKSESGNTLASCISALSSTVREFAPASNEITSQGGCEFLVNVLKGPHVGARTKAAFLIRYLCHHHAPAKEKIIQANIVKVIAELIKSGRDETSEHLLNILQGLVESPEPTIVQQCTDRRVDLKSVLKNHLKLAELQDDTYIEEKEYCNAVLKAIEDYALGEELLDEVDR